MPSELSTQRFADDVRDRVFDKGIVIDGDARVALLGGRVITTAKCRIVVTGMVLSEGHAQVSRNAKGTPGLHGLGKIFGS